MSLFRDLSNASDSKDSLESYIGCHINEISVFESLPYEEQKNEMDDFESFVLLKNDVIEQLDYSDSNNKAFVYYLIDYSVRIRSRSTFVYLYDIIKAHGLNIGSRLEAAMVFLYNVSENAIFVERFCDICHLLQIAINTEEDNNLKAIKTFLNYYSYVAQISESYASKIREKYQEAISDNAYHFLNDSRVKDFFSSDTPDIDKLEDFVFSQDKKPLISKIIKAKDKGASDFEKESDTPYSREIETIPATFKAIRDLSIRFIDDDVDGEEVFLSLGRGTAILENEQQLLRYMKSYGKMHEQKILSALENFPIEELYDREVAVFDWGCGQGLASIVFKEYIDKHDVAPNFSRINLIEPSVIALKRAGLHVRHFYNSSEIRTICKYIDSIKASDLNSKGEINIHFFSNVLDMESFSLNQLIQTIKTSMTGINYFFCISPYITDAKTNRLDRFVNAFTDSNQFEMFYSVDSVSGDWINGWTRAIRVFKATI